VTGREESSERLVRGVEESATRQAELRARVERVTHREDLIELVRRGVEETTLRNIELRARLDRLRSGAPVTAEDVAAAAAGSAAAHKLAADAQEQAADFRELAAYVHEAAAAEHEQAVREGVGDPIEHLRRARRLHAEATPERANADRKRLQK